MNYCWMTGDASGLVSYAGAASCGEEPGGRTNAAVYQSFALWLYGDAGNVASTVG